MTAAEFLKFRFIESLGVSASRIVKSGLVDQGLHAFELAPFPLKQSVVGTVVDFHQTRGVKSSVENGGGEEAAVDFVTLETHFLVTWVVLVVALVVVVCEAIN